MAIQPATKQINQATPKRAAVLEEQTTDEALAIAEKLAATADAIVLTSREKVPSDWHLEHMDDGRIHALNNITSRVFEGSLADFNKLLRS